MPQEDSLLLICIPKAIKFWQFGYVKCQSTARIRENKKIQAEDKENTSSPTHLSFPRSLFPSCYVISSCYFCCAWYALIGLKSVLRCWKGCVRWCKNEQRKCKLKWSTDTWKYLHFITSHLCRSLNPPPRFLLTCSEKCWAEKASKPQHNAISVLFNRLVWP